MMKSDPNDIELLVEFTSLLSKYGKRRIEQVISLLNDRDSVEKVINILSEAIQLVDKNTPIKEKHQGIMKADENSLLIGKINKLLRDRRIFNSAQDLDVILGEFQIGINNSKTKSEKLKVFNLYLSRLDYQTLQNIYTKCEAMAQKKVNSTPLETDLSKWSDIIVKKKESKEQ